MSDESYYEVEISEFQNGLRNGIVYRVTPHGREEINRIKTDQQERDALVERAKKIARRHRKNLIRLDLDD